jgi:hypothetical protein
MTVFTGPNLGIVCHDITTTGGDIVDSTAYRAMRYMLAFTLFGDGGYGPCASGYNINTQVNLWFDDFAVGPTGVAYTYAQATPDKLGYLGPRVGGRVKLANGIQMQERQNGMVLINWKTNGTQTVTTANLGGSNLYKRIQGTQDPAVNSGAPITASFTMPARSGLILLKRSVFG